jgi:hypothetical protein
MHLLKPSLTTGLLTGSIMTPFRPLKSLSAFSCDLSCHTRDQSTRNSVLLTRFDRLAIKKMTLGVA